MTDEILYEIKKFFEDNKCKTEIQIYSDIFNRLDVDFQFRVIDSIQYLVAEEKLDVQEAVTQVFNNILQGMR